LIGLPACRVREGEFRDNYFILGEFVVRRDDVGLEVVEIVAVPMLMNSEVNKSGWFAR